MSGEFFVYHRPLVAGLSCSDLVGSYASGSMNNTLCLLAFKTLGSSQPPLLNPLLILPVNRRGEPWLI